MPQFENSPEVTILFTGYVNPTTPAERLTKSGRAQTMRWNVHPLLSDTVALVRATQATTVIPAFCDRAKLAALAAALTPARVTMEQTFEFRRCSHKTGSHENWAIVWLAPRKQT